MTTATGSTSNGSVPHGLADEQKIRSINIIIRNDAGTAVNDFNAQDSTGTGNVLINAASVYFSLQTQAGGRFDHPDFDTMGGDGNRGWITIQYVD